ncbi:MAG TPA: hypothetical protein VJC15_01715 [Candidatus Paceibacterota bacterium]
MVRLGKYVLKNSALRAILFAVALLVLGEMALAWQYQRLEKGLLSDLEEKVQEQQQVMEERDAQGALEKFLEARVAGDEQKASRYVTEEAMQQLQQGLFEFSGAQDYKILRKEKLGEGVFRFQVEITRDQTKQIELIELQKISDEYYVNSVQLAG